MKYKVRATSAYKENNMIDLELNKIPDEGEEWVVDALRKDKLCGENDYNVVFAKVIEEIKEAEDIKIKEDEEQVEEKEIKEAGKTKKGMKSK